MLSVASYTGVSSIHKILLDRYLINSNTHFISFYALRVYKGRVMLYYDCLQAQ